MRAPSRSVVALLAIAALASGSATISGCQTYEADLARSQRAFEHADYERALAIFRALEPDLANHYSQQEQAQYAYLRGMTDYRIGYKADARHWLAIAHAIDASSSGMLPADWRGRMTETLAELNEQVYVAGLDTLSDSQQDAAKSKPAGAKAKPKSEDEP